MVAATAVDRLNPIAAMAHDKKRIVLSEKKYAFSKSVAYVARVLHCSMEQKSVN